MDQRARFRELANQVNLETKGLHLLLKAGKFAANLSTAIEDFAVEIERLLAAGLGECELRWLIRKGFVTHFVDTTLPGECERRLRCIPTQRFVKESCFALTKAGLDFAASLPTMAAVCSDTTIVAPTPARPTPIWISASRKLVFKGIAIKNLRVLAPNQELILSAFEEEHWANCIDDPLPPIPGIESCSRLNKTVYRLNQSLNPPLIHFFCNGGNSVHWQDRSNDSKRDKVIGKHSE